MKCRLCDRPTAAGTGKLCADCAKALRRARGASTSAPRKLPLSQRNGAETSAAADVVLTPVAPAIPANRSKRRATWAAIGLATVAVAIAIVYVAQPDTVPGNAGAALAGRSPASSTDRPVVDASPVAPRIEEPSWTAVGNAAETKGTSATSQLEFDAGTIPVAPPSMASTGAKTGAKPGSTGKKPNQDAKAAPPPPALNHDTVPTKPPESEPQQQLARAGVAHPVQSADGAQVLASAMEKCGKESLLSKFICEQKTYMQYCEDKWDNDPRCMRKTADR